MRSIKAFLVLSILVLLFAPIKVFAGTWTSSSADTYYTGGKVGIGTTAPTFPVHIYDTSAGNWSVDRGSLMIGDTGGSTWIGNYYDSSSNAGGGMIAFNAYMNSTNNWLRRKGNLESWFIDVKNTGNNTGSFSIWRNNYGGSDNSNITATQMMRLNAGGTLYVKELIVKDPANGWPDYVFEDDYKLMTLGEVEKYINENNYLPGVPNAQTIAVEGITIGEMQTKQMEKIEELTLHLIVKDKQIEDLYKRLEKLETLLLTK